MGSTQIQSTLKRFLDLYSEYRLHICDPRTKMVLPRIKSDQEYLDVLNILRHFSTLSKFYCSVLEPMMEKKKMETQEVEDYLCILAGIYESELKP